MRFRLLGRWVLGASALIAPMTIITSGAEAQQSLAGSQGTDTALPTTDSAVTVNGRGRFGGLAITVNQTRNLSNQAVSITWSGGTPTRSGPSRFAAHYLQIFQCWGDPDGSVPENPGPPPEQCVQGASAGAPDAFFGGLVPPGSNVLDRIIRRNTWAPLDPPLGVVDPGDRQTWMPFRSVEGDTVDFQTNSSFVAGQAGNFWLNPFYDIVTTNEIAVAATAPDGSGQALFEVNTGVESSGLGCGQSRQPLPGGGTKVPQCWIVIVPRGEPVDENVNTSFDLEGENANRRGVLTSPLGPQAWPNRIAIPIDFNPVDSGCDITVRARPISGTELAVPAVVRWQPVLCGGGELPPFSYATAADSAARLQLSRGTAGMAVISRPLEQPEDPSKQVVYAPLTVSGVGIGFNIERTPRPDAPDDAQALAGIRFAELNLTPRLVAKLLTHSYRGQVDLLFQPSGYEWAAENPGSPYGDPDFLQFNEEFAQQQLSQGRQLSGLHLPTGNSDAAQTLWEWVLSDPEARAWVDGEPDEWGMVVNPAYDVVVSSAPQSFPKADPYCYQAPPVTVFAEPYSPPPLCTLDWMPTANGFADAARNTRRAFDGARIGQNLADPPSSPSAYWRRTTPQLIGQRGFLSITDSASASQFGIQMARLSRAGDNGPDRQFVGPTVEALGAGLSSMTPGPEPQVLEPNPLEQPAGAYPLTIVSYAAVAPLTLNARARDEYAAFIEYAAGQGQRSGETRGQLPRGYAPLPTNLREQAVQAAEVVRNGTLVVVVVVPEPTTTTTVAPTTTTTTTTQPAAGSQNPVFPTGQGSSSRPTGGGSSSPSSPSTGTTTTTTTVATDSTVPDESTPEAPSTSEPAPSSAPPTSAPEGDAVDVPGTSLPPGVTPSTEVSPLRFAVAGFTGTGLLAALVALEITKRPRRGAVGSDDEDDDLFGEPDEPT